MNVKTYLLSALILTLTSACSGTYRAYYQTFKIALAAQKGAEKTFTEVQQSTVDLISVKRGAQPDAILALAYIESGQHKWVSADHSMLVIENGRIIRSLGLTDNLLYLSNTKNDPLRHLPNILKDPPQKQIWSRIADRTGDEYGYPIESSFSRAQKKTIEALGLNIETVSFSETVNYKAPSNYLRPQNNWKNQYWFAKNGELIKSIQKFSPLSEPLEITYLSRIARLNK
jgi:hypothetical protein